MLDGETGSGAECPRPPLPGSPDEEGRACTTPPTAAEGGGGLGVTGMKVLRCEQDTRVHTGRRPGPSAPPVLSLLTTRPQRHRLGRLSADPRPGQQRRPDDLSQTGAEAPPSSWENREFYTALPGSGRSPQQPHTLCTSPQLRRGAWGSAPAAGPRRDPRHRRAEGAEPAHHPPLHSTSREAPAPPSSGPKLKKVSSKMSSRQKFL